MFFIGREERRNTMWWLPLRYTGHAVWALLDSENGGQVGKPSLPPSFMEGRTHGFHNKGRVLHQGYFLFKSSYCCLSLMSTCLDSIANRTMNSSYTGPLFVLCSRPTLCCCSSYWLNLHLASCFFFIFISHAHYTWFHNLLSWKSDRCQKHGFIT